MYKYCVQNHIILECICVSNVSILPLFLMSNFELFPTVWYCIGFYCIKYAHV